MPWKAGPTVTPYSNGASAFTPRSVVAQYVYEGPQSSYRRLLELIDFADDAWPVTAGLLREMGLAGVELDATAVVIAVKLGRRQWNKSAAMFPSGRYDPTLASMSDAIVYYIRRRDLIKIGTTTDPVERFDALMPDEILAFEPGSYEEETFRHRQFAHLRCRGEHFTPEAELLLHIQHVRSLHGDPDPSWPTAAHFGKERRGTLPSASAETITAPDAAAKLGIKEGTVRAWLHRGRITPVGRDYRGRYLYYIDHLTALRDKSRTRATR